MHSRQRRVSMRWRNCRLRRAATIGPTTIEAAPAVINRTITNEGGPLSGACRPALSITQSIATKITTKNRKVPRTESAALIGASPFASNSMSANSRRQDSSSNRSSSRTERISRKDCHRWMRGSPCRTSHPTTNAHGNHNRCHGETGKRLDMSRRSLRANCRSVRHPSKRRRVRRTLRVGSQTSRQSHRPYGALRVSTTRTMLRVHREQRIRLSYGTKARARYCGSVGSPAVLGARICAHSKGNVRRSTQSQGGP